MNQGNSGEKGEPGTPGPTTSYNEHEQLVAGLNEAISGKKGDKGIQVNTTTN